jgi:cardiolipin synthase
MRHKVPTVSNGYTAVNQVELIRAGKEYFNRLLQLIHEAEESIHLQAYIYSDDETGRLVADALKEAVKRNVAVYLMADGYASQGMSQSFIDELKMAGIHFRFFKPIFKSWYVYFSRRMHHKVAVADAKYAIVGGINIANRYNDMPGKPAWLDFSLYVEGEIAKHLCVLCWKTWKGYPLNIDITPCDEKQINFSIPLENQSEVRMRQNDWVRHKNEISGTYIEMLLKAQTQVTILCSYFLPGKVIRREMVHAIKRGVSIRVIAAGPSDVMLAKYAERWLYDWLLRNGIELYEYQKNILHGKIAVCDDRWMTIGSYNINNISTYASIELNLDVRNPVFAKEVREKLEEIIVNDCIPITPVHQIETKNIFKQFIRWFSYEFIRIVFYLFTFYFKHRS